MARPRIRVLIVDDDAHVRAALREVLEGQPDLRCVGSAGSAATAVSACEEYDPDVVLVDVRLPGGGVAAAREITARWPRVGVVALSVYGDRRHRELMSAAGAARYVVKGTPNRELLHTIREVAAERRG